MRRFLAFGAVAAAVVMLTLTVLAQDKPEEKALSERLQRDMMQRMKELLEQTHASLAAGKNDDALIKYGEFKKIYGEVQAGRITVKEYKANMEMYWKLAEDKVGPRMRKLEKEKAAKKPEEKALPLPEQHSKMVEMEKLLSSLYQHVANGDDQNALAACEKMRKINEAVEKGRITKEEYRERIAKSWALALEKMGDKLKEAKSVEKPSEPEKKPEDKPAEKPAEEPKEEAKKKPEGSEYFPLEPGTSWTYRSGGAEALVNVSRTEKYREKQCIVTETVSSLKIVQRQWLHVSDEGIYIMKNWNPRAVEEYNKPFPRATFPFKKGQTWKWFGKMAGKDVSYSFQVKGEKTVTVPAGKFTGLEIVTIVRVNRELTTIKEVFAPGVGLVYLERELPNRRQKQKIELVKYTIPGKEKEEKKK